MEQNPCLLEKYRMRRRRICAINSRFSVTLVLIMLTIAVSPKIPAPAQAHFFEGVTQDLADGYQILFVLSPSTPSTGDNSTRLNFSILKDGRNADNVYVALTIKEKDSGKVEEQLPYKWYEFSDISIPYKFQKVTNYVITVEARVNRDPPKYLATPLVANFDIRAKDPNDILSDNPPLVRLIGVVFAILAIASIIPFIKRKDCQGNKNRKQLVSSIWQRK